MAKSLEQPKRRTRPRRKLGESVVAVDEPKLDASDLDTLAALEDLPAPPPTTVINETTVSLSPTAHAALVLRDNPELVSQTIQELGEDPVVLSSMLLGLAQEPGLVNLLPQQLQEFLLEILTADQE